MAGCKGMVEKLKNPDTDYHRQKASDMFNVPYELVTKQLRQMSKGVNFGILYGLGDPNLGVNLYGNKSRENTRKAKAMKEKYYIGMEELKPFTEESKAQGVTQGFSTTYFKRRRWYNKAKVRKDTIERQSCNARIQGTAADLYKLAMVRLFEEIKRRGWVDKFLISAFVHDECLNEVSKSINPFLALKVVREAMMIEIEGWTTLFTGMGVGATWYEAKKTEIPVQVQVSLIEKYADETPDWWNGDIRVLSDFINNEIREYMKNRVISFLENENNWGKVLMPTENELCHEVVENMEKGVKYEGQLEGIEVKSSKDMLENLEMFCRAFGIEDLFAKADIKKPEEGIQTGGLSSDDDFEDDEKEEEEIDFKKMVSTQVSSMGVFLTPSSLGKKTLYFRLDANNPVLMKLVRNAIDEAKGEKDTEVRCFKNGVEYTTGLVTNGGKAYTEILKLYLSARNMSVRR
jgi:hypothetical protein